MNLRAIITDERIGVVALFVLLGVVIWSLLQFSLQYEVSRLEQRDREYAAHDDAAIREVEARHIREMKELEDRHNKRLDDIQGNAESSAAMKQIIANQKIIIEMLGNRK